MAFKPALITNTSASVFVFHVGIILTTMIKVGHLWPILKIYLFINIILFDLNLFCSKSGGSL